MTRFLSGDATCPPAVGVGGASSAMKRKAMPLPKLRFFEQRSSAKRRGIAWEMTFGEWWSIWQESGKWGQRGRGKGCYCMSRFGDVGPYRVSNVSITTYSANAADAARKMLLTRVPGGGSLGNGKGWSFVRRPNGTDRYEVKVARRYVGAFRTQAEAEAAYRAEVSRVQHLESPAASVFRMPGAATPSQP